MNLKKSVLSFMAAGAILAGSFAGVAAQDSDKVDGNVSVANVGVFDVQFCEDTDAAVNPAADIDFGPVNVTTAQAAAPVVRTVVICYEDTMTQRGPFDTRLTSGPFIDGTKTFSNSALKVHSVEFVNSGTWGPGVGSIAGRVTPGGAVTRANSPASWGNTTFADGGGSRVSYINAGSGTGSDFYQTQPSYDDPAVNYAPDARSSAGSWQRINLELTVPAGTAPGNYTSEITVTVAPPTP